MYQDSVKVKGYNKKMMHKEKQKKLFVKSVFSGCNRYKSYDDYFANCGEFDRYKVDGIGKEHREMYWRRIDFGHEKKWLKQMSSRTVRRKMNLQLHAPTDDAHEVICSRSLYKKYYDIAWNLW